MGSTAASRRSWPFWLGLALLALAGLALFAPPGPVPPALVAPGASLLERLFPGVPAAWVGIRLALLLAGACLVAWASGEPPSWTLPARSDTPPPRPAFAAAALVWALVHVIVAFGARRLSPLAQLLYVVALAGSPTLLVLGTPQRKGAVRPFRAALASSRAGLLLAVVLGAAWLTFRLPLAWHAPRAAIPVDLWQSFGWLLDASGQNVLAGTGQPGVPTTYMLFLGVTILDMLAWPATLAWVQSWHAGWILVTALGIGWLAAVTLRGVTPVVVVAVYLFSPAVLMLPFSPSPFGLFTAYVVLLLLLLLGFHACTSPSLLAALAAVAGLAAPNAYLTHFAALAVGGALVLQLRRRPRPAWVFWTIPPLVFLAAVLPSLPDPLTLREMASRYLEPEGIWAALEALAMGQLSASDADQVYGLWFAGTRGFLDVPLGSLLSPFAIPRTPLRMWGDSLFEPLGLLLGAVGLAVCVRHARRHVGARVLLGLLLIALLPGTFTSAYDRASLTRNVALPVSMALLAGAGFEALSRRLPVRLGELRVALVVAGLAALGGIVLFDGVAPRILPASHLAIALESLDVTLPAGGALLLEPGPERIDWLHVATIGAHLPRQPIPSLPYGDSSSLREARAEVVFWSPGLEAAVGVSSEICRQWRDAAVYLLRDRAGIFECLAGRRAESAWRPSIPRTRWERVGCTPSA